MRAVIVRVKFHSLGKCDNPVEPVGFQTIVIALAGKMLHLVFAFRPISNNQKMAR
jgi:hypothetical protein